MLGCDLEQAEHNTTNEGEGEEKGFMNVLLIFFFCILCVVVANDANFYEILGLTAGEDDDRLIKSAYRAKALKYHPDKVSSHEEKQGNEVSSVACCEQVLTAARVRSLPSTSTSPSTSPHFTSLLLQTHTPLYHTYFTYI